MGPSVYPAQRMGCIENPFRRSAISTHDEIRDSSRRLLHYLSGRWTGGLQSLLGCFPRFKSLARFSTNATNLGQFSAWRGVRAVRSGTINIGIIISSSTKVKGRSNETIAPPPSANSRLDWPKGAGHSHGRLWNTRAIRRAHGRFSRPGSNRGYSPRGWDRLRSAPEKSGEHLS